MTMHMSIKKKLDHATNILADVCNMSEDHAITRVKVFRIVPEIRTEADFPQKAGPKIYLIRQLN